MTEIEALLKPRQRPNNEDYPLYDHDLPEEFSRHAHNVMFFKFPILPGGPVTKAVADARKGIYKMQEGQTRPVAEMTEEEIDVHNKPIMDAMHKLEIEEGDSRVKLYSQLYRPYFSLNYYKGVSGLDYVCNRFDVSPAVKYFGKEWLDNEECFNG